MVRVPELMESVLHVRNIQDYYIENNDGHLNEQGV